MQQPTFRFETWFFFSSSDSRRIRRIHNKETDHEQKNSAKGFSRLCTCPRTIGAARSMASAVVEEAVALLHRRRLFYGSGGPCATSLVKVSTHHFTTGHDTGITKYCTISTFDIASARWIGPWFAVHCASRSQRVARQNISASATIAATTSRPGSATTIQQQ